MEVAALTQSSRVVGLVCVGTVVSPDGVAFFPIAILTQASSVYLLVLVAAEDFSPVRLIVAQSLLHSKQAQIHSLRWGSTHGLGLVWPQGMDRHLMLSIREGEVISELW